MATNSNTDLTEEDAADLQFPKEIVTKFCGNVIPQEKSVPVNVYDSDCRNCLNELSTPYIVCTVCNYNICTTCFANGMEFSKHKNDHDYSVLNNNFILFENSDWTAREELTLLEALLEFGNWDLVAKQLQSRRVKEIKEHYNYFYLQRRGCDLLPKFSVTYDSYYPEPIIPYRFRLMDVDEPPRYGPNSAGFNSVAGYNAARSDFELEYDTNAEDLICNLSLEVVDKEDPDYNLLCNLQCAIIRSYNRRLWERRRRKNIIRNHGLILFRKTVAWLHRYDMTITRSVCDRMCRFMQFYKGTEFDYLMEGLHRAGELKVQIHKLCDFRKKGITTLAGAQLFMKLKHDKEVARREVKAFQTNPQFSWRFKNTIITQHLPTTSKKRGTFTPLDVVGLPGYEKLSSKEQDLCKTARLVPLAYLELRHILVTENKKLGHLKLQTARRLLKIDVNKTRRLYDFLVNEGYINKA